MSTADFRRGACHCGQLRVDARGEPARVSIRHCLSCKRRSGSAFAAQARWPNADVTITGAFSHWSTVGDNGLKAEFRFCPSCGSTIAYETESLPGLTAIPMGVFADPEFPAPDYSVFENRMHPWIAILGKDVVHD